ncbi:PucR family transcriptional regulator [Patulibacter defluvii]|uniref:PucR family transcriptional regulator n=1 Tax=Patulibacter defluvii TaxID=3095358 RepID=UPI002A766120|nr:helix-turn-helix domain-containing protein [Patulibacter sp. DM4]
MARAAIRAAARETMRDAEQVAAAADRVICERLGLEGEALRASLAASTLAHVTLIAGMLGAGADPASAVPPPETVRWATDLVAEGRSPTDLLRAYRLGHAEVWAGWLRILRRNCPQPGVLDEATTATSAFLFAYVDAVLQPLVDHQAEERARLSARIETMRAETIRDLLTAAAPDVPAASARLRYDVDRRHVAVALWALPTETAAARVTRLEAAAARLPAPRLVAPGPGDVLYAWVVSEAAPEIVARPGIVAATGRPARGLAGFRSSHAEARRALEVARAAGSDRPRVIAYEDVEVVVLLQHDGAGARAFAERVLAPLSDEIVATLGALHDAGMSVAAVAQRLAVHPNTVGYRVRRALALTGEPDPGSLRLRAAVAIARFGPGGAAGRPAGDRPEDGD